MHESLVKLDIAI